MHAKLISGILTLLSSFPMLFLGVLLILTPFAILAPIFLFLGIFTLIMVLATRFYKRDSHGKSPRVYASLHLLFVAITLIWLWSWFIRFGTNTDAQDLMVWINITAFFSLIYPVVLLIQSRSKI